MIGRYRVAYADRAGNVYDICDCPSLIAASFVAEEERRMRQHQVVFVTDVKDPERGMLLEGDEDD